MVERKQRTTTMTKTNNTNKKRNKNDVEMVVDEEVVVDTDNESSNNSSSSSRTDSSQNENSDNDDSSKENDVEENEIMKDQQDEENDSDSSSSEDEDEEEDDDDDDDDSNNPDENDDEEEEDDDDDDTSTDKSSDNSKEEEEEENDKVKVVVQNEKQQQQKDNINNNNNQKQTKKMAEEEEDSEKGILSTTTAHVVNNNNNNSNTAVVVVPGIVSLSKSWSIQAAHIPTYTGGKIETTFSFSSTTTTNTTKSTKTTTSNNNKNNTIGYYLFTPVSGDVMIVNAQTGTPIGSVRRGLTSSTTPITNSNTNNNNNEENNDDDDYDDDQNNQYDGDAITAFAVSSNYEMIITCTRNMMMNQYQLQLPPPSIAAETTNQEDDDDNDSDSSNDDDDNDKALLQQRDKQQESSTSTTSKSLSNYSVVLQRCWGKVGHTLPVLDLQYHSSNLFLASSSVDGTVRIWDVMGGYVTHVYRPLTTTTTNTSSTNNTGGIRAVTVIQWYPSLTEYILGIGRDDGSICIHNLLSSKLSDVVVLGTNNDEHVGSVTCLQWHMKNQYLISCGRDQVINLWNYSIMNTTTNNKQKNKNHIQNQKNKNKSLVTDNSKNATIVSYTYKKLKTIPLYEQIEGLVILDNPNNQNNNKTIFIATIGTLGCVRLWMVSEKNGITLYGQQMISDTFGEKRGGYVYLRAIMDPTITTTSTTTTIATKTMKNVPLSLLVADAENNISFLSITGISWGSTTETTTTTPPSLSPIPPTIVTTRTIVGHNDEILDLKMIPSSSTNNNKNNNKNQQQHIVVVTNTSQVRIFDLQTFSCVHVLDEHTATCLCVDVSPCGNYVVTCGKDKTARIWSMPPPQEIQERVKNDETVLSSTKSHPLCVGLAIGHTEAVGSVAFSRKMNRYDTSGSAAKNGAGAFIVTVSSDRTIKRWNLPGNETFKQQQQQQQQQRKKKQEQSSTTSGTDVLHLTAFVSNRAHEKDINIVTVAPNDSLIATGSQDKTIKLWNATDLSLVATLKGHKRGVWDCQFSMTDRILASASGDKTIKLWSIASGDYHCVRTFQGHTSSVLRVRFLSAGLQLVSSGSDGLIKLWTIRTNECESTMDTHTEKVWALDMNTTGTVLVSGGADSKIVVWKDTTQEVAAIAKAIEEEAILLDQKLANHLRRNEYGEALDISLERDKPHLTLKVLNSIIEAASDPNSTSNGQQQQQHQKYHTIGITNILNDIKKYSNVWLVSDERLIRLLRYCRDWNTKARNCHVALFVLKVIVTTIPVEKLVTIGGLPEILAGIIPYAERHFDRYDKLHENSYLLDFALASMGVLDPIQTVVLDDQQDDGDDNELYRKWEMESKFVLPPKQLDGRIDVGGNVIVGSTSTNRNNNKYIDSTTTTAGNGNDDDEVMIIGESDSDDDSI